jgi:hypothetical protein
VANQTLQKRAREIQRQERARDKQRRREQRRSQKEARTPAADGAGPDIAGIVPGPQPTED